MTQLKKHCRSIPVLLITLSERLFCVWAYAGKRRHHSGLPDLAQVPRVHLVQFLRSVAGGIWGAYILWCLHSMSRLLSSHRKTLRQSFFLPFVSLLGSFAVVTQENVSQNTEENGEAEQHCSTFADTQFWCPQETQHHLAATINCIGSTASSQLNVHMNTFTDT